MKKTNILIVEDEPITANAIKKMLENLGYDVSEIMTSGEEAVDRISAVNPDIVIMDITLAGEIDGIEAAAQINTCHQVPIIYLTANTNNEVIHKAKHETKSYGYLLKPVKGMDLHWTINTALKRHQIESNQ